MNYLYYGDNLDILREYIRDESVDLIYLDPPFNSNQGYNILFQEKNGTKSSAQIQAFEDTWHWDIGAEETWTKIVEKNPNRNLADLMIAMRRFLGTNDIMAYLVMMAARVEELRRVLKPTGSVYLHCDPTASHYLKLVMDAVFGPKTFRNEIVWHYKTFHGQVKRYFARKHDVIFLYTKSDLWKFNQLFDTSYTETIDFQRWKKYLVNGNKIMGANMPLQDTRFVRYYRRWLKEHEQEPELTDVVYELKGQPVDTVWDIKAVDPKDSDRLGYPTQKPEALLERIIKASSNEGDTVLDPFCGCGTTITVAEKMKRNWIGIDITHLAVALMEYRLRDTFGNSVEYEVVGIPVSVKGAEDLAKRDPFQFQSWVLSLVKAKPEPAPGPDKGIDGRIYFHDDPEHKEIKEIVIQVKGGRHVNPGMVDALRGVVEKENAQIGVLITLQRPTRGMTTTAVSAGFYKSPIGKQYPKIQILTIGDIFDGKGIQRPPEGIAAIDRTFKKAKKYKGEQGKQKEMFHGRNGEK